MKICVGGINMGNTLKVLIAENCEEFDKESCDTLNKYGLEATFVPKDGFKVLEVIEKLNPDVVLLDLFMSRVDAIGVIRNVNKNHKIKSPVFIVLSNFDSPVLEKEALSEGAAYFVIKPFNTKDLCERIINFSKIKMDDNQRKVRSTMSSIKSDSSNDIEIKVTEILHQIGVPAHIKGYHYLRNSIMTSIENPDIINAVTKQLYPSVAKEFKTTSSRVERAIRHAIEVAWDRGDVDILNSYFGYTIHNGRGKPTNSEFIAMISDKLRLQLKTAC